MCVARTHTVPGTTVTHVLMYESDGWLSYSDEELLDEVRDYQRRGFHAVKIKVGSPDLQRDIARLRKVREAVGPHLKIMMDVNQCMDVSSAIKISMLARQIGIRCLKNRFIPMTTPTTAIASENRRHSGMNYQSPNNFERKHQEKIINTETHIIQQPQ